MARGRVWPDSVCYQSELPREEAGCESGGVGPVPTKGQRVKQMVGGVQEVTCNGPVFLGGVLIQEDPVMASRGSRG